MNRKFPILAVVLFSLVFMINAQAQNDWKTPAEKTDYRTTPTYDETRAFIERLDRASPLVKLTSFGKTAQGRDLMLIVAAKDADKMTPELARKQGKAIVLIQACIHAGESDGKDAGLALLRDIAITKNQQNLLESVVILFEPIYNADGHERRSPYNRINQNGPEEMGWRGNGRNINLNRDYMKADELETKAWLRLWNLWNPDFFIDCHVTNGADYQYDLTYQFEHHETVAPAIKNWLETAIEGRAVAATEKNGHLLSPYLQFADNRDLSKGIFEFVASPRFASTYPVLRNRPAILIETHMLKPYKTRVIATYDFILAMLAEINQNSGDLFGTIKQAETQEADKYFSSYNANTKFPLSLKLTDKSTPFQLKAVESKVEKSEISGADWVKFDSSKPFNITIPFFNQTEIAASVAPPIAYVVPAQWIEVIERLELHGLKIERTTKPQTFEVEMYRLTQPKWAPASFESRVMLTDFKSAVFNEKRQFPAGSVIVRLNQPNAKAAVHLLEPAAPDSLLRWGFFNPIFEQKEYGESYVLEKLSREMLAKDADLKREFEERLKTDENFAKNPRARLNFFFERSPYFDKNIGLYPVGRIIKFE
ncbi:MAG: M14 family metallopeptidase [Acidobacteriota bacterium]|nr:M14 family metallopeptidase [Acidobacteriota bacterium]